MRGIEECFQLIPSTIIVSGGLGTIPSELCKHREVQEVRHTLLPKVTKQAQYEIINHHLLGKHYCEL